MCPHKFKNTNVCCSLCFWPTTPRRDNWKLQPRRILWRSAFATPWAYGQSSETFSTAKTANIVVWNPVWFNKIDKRHLFYSQICLANIARLTRQYVKCILTVGTHPHKWVGSQWFLIDLLKKVHLWTHLCTPHTWRSFYSERVLVISATKNKSFCFFPQWCKRYFWNTINAWIDGYKRKSLKQI